MQRIKFFKNKASVESFLRTKKAVCGDHGEHSEWHYYKGKTFERIHCRVCEKLYLKQRREEKTLDVLLNEARKRSKEFNRKFNLTLKYLNYLVKKQKNCCALTGLPFGKTSENRPSIDRIDSKKGYEKGNVQLILVKVNVMKSFLDLDEFLFFCDKISKYTESHPKR